MPDLPQAAALETLPELCLILPQRPSLLRHPAAIKSLPSTHSDVPLWFHHSENTVMLETLCFDFSTVSMGFLHNLCFSLTTPCL